MLFGLLSSGSVFVLVLFFESHVLTPSTRSSTSESVSVSSPLLKAEGQFRHFHSKGGFSPGTKNLSKKLGAFPQGVVLIGPGVFWTSLLIGGNDLSAMLE